MIRLKNITMRNFLSVGNITQAINFETAGLTLVLGNNLDLGGDGSRNGTGKTSMLNALSYALYGQAISNIKKNNLINLTNKKGMLVTVEFDINGNQYRIERGRSPNVLKFLVNNVDAVDETDEGQGEMRLTQQEIEKTIGMNHVMFKQLIALNTYDEPFLSLRTNDQRAIIENLLGITMLSEKALLLKDQIKITKDQIKEEEYRIKGIENANEQIKKSIVDLERRQNVWKEKNQKEIQDLEQKIKELEYIDLETELEQHIALEEYNRSSAKLSNLKKAIANAEASIQREKRIETEATQALEQAHDKKCYACGHALKDETKTAKIINEKTSILEKATKQIDDDHREIEQLNQEIDNIQLPSSIPQTLYETAQEAYTQVNSLNNFKSKLEELQKSKNPYSDQISILNETGIQEINWDTINSLHQLREHQEFLFKLLTNKDSFIRKQIIEQNLEYLNSRLNYYLSKLGLPHEVVFQSDLSVEITELGRELDFDNLSRGERNRLILGLSWAFRDVHESTNQPIDFLAIDELIDNGLDQTGVDAALQVLKKFTRDRQKNIFLISHRDELLSNIDNILQVTKENGFTHFN